MVVRSGVRFTGWLLVVWVSSFSCHCIVIGESGFGVA